MMIHVFFLFSEWLSATFSAFVGDADLLKLTVSSPPSIQLVPTMTRSTAWCTELWHEFDQCRGPPKVVFAVYLVGGNWLPWIWNCPINIGLRWSSQLTNSIIFQRGGPGPPTSYDVWESLNSKQTKCNAETKMTVPTFPQRPCMVPYILTFDIQRDGVSLRWSVFIYSTHIYIHILHTIDTYICILHTTSYFHTII